MLGKLTKPAARILGPTSQRASSAPSEWRTSWERVSEARCLLFREPSVVVDVAGEVGEDVTDGCGESTPASSWSWSARRVLEDVNTKAVEAFLLLLVEVLVEVVARMGLQSSRLMKVGWSFVLDDCGPGLGRAGDERGGAGREKDKSGCRPFRRARGVAVGRHYRKCAGDMSSSSPSRGGAGGRHLR